LLSSVAYFSIYFHRLKNLKSATAIFIELPLPQHIDEKQVSEAVPHLKDVDGLNENNSTEPKVLPAAVLAIMEVLKRHQVPLKEAKAVLIGNIKWAKQLVPVLALSGCSTTLLDGNSEDMFDVTRSADILISAYNKPDIIKATGIKRGAVVIDVGCTVIQDPSRKLGWRIKGDVCTEEVTAQCSLLSPSTGGIGPIIVAMLAKNTITLHDLQINKPTLQ